MKRFHVHLSVPDLDASVRFYSDLFGVPPSVAKGDYAKWMLDEPRVNFAISQRNNGKTGLNHLGLQVESEDELAAVRRQFAAADFSSTAAEPGANCCYALSNKHWVTDPQGIPWEAFHSLDSIPVWGDSNKVGIGSRESGCCTAAGTSTTTEAAIDRKPISGAAAGCCAPRAAAASAESCC